MKIYVAARIYDIGSCHPEIDIQVFRDQGKAYDYAREEAQREGVVFENDVDGDQQDVIDEMNEMDDDDDDMSEGYVTVVEFDI